MEYEVYRMECPRCDSKKLGRVRPEHYQNERLRCLNCGLVFHPRLSYEFEYECYHPGICGRCKQKIEK